MKKFFVAIAVMLVACGRDPVPQPAPSASASASVRVPASAEAAPAVATGPIPVASAEPAPDGSAAVPTTATPVAWGVVELGPWMVGRWVSKQHGDAIPKGPLGGEIMPSGVRAELVKGRPGSKTPWNVTFWGPTSGHLSSTTISGGCGFYESGVAFCKGYGLPPSQHAHETRIALMGSGPEGGELKQLQFVITDLFSSGPLVRVLP